MNVSKGLIKLSDIYVKILKFFVKIPTTYNFGKNINVFRQNPYFVLKISKVLIEISKVFKKLNEKSQCHAKSVQKTIKIPIKIH